MKNSLGEYAPVHNNRRRPLRLVSVQSRALAVIRRGVVPRGQIWETLAR